MQKIKWSLIALTIGGFGIGMTEFVMMTVLPDIAKSLNITIPKAGHLVSAYALGVVIGAPLLVALAGSHPPKKILMFLMGLFTLFNAITAFAPSYTLLFIARLLCGLPHGAFFGVGAVVASRIAEKGQEARAVSVMFAGLTFANIIGIPVVTFIGHHFSWRITFMIISVVGLGAIASLSRWMPDMPGASNPSIKKDLALFTHLEPWLVIGITAIGTGGLFAWFSYIAPLLTKVTGFSPDVYTITLILAGCGMAVGNVIGGRLADRFSPLNATSSLLLLMAVCLIVMTFAAPYKAPVLIMTFITGAVAFAMASPIQMLVINSAHGAEMLASAMGQASFNMGNAIGAFLGGLPLAAGFGFTSPEWVGAGLAGTGCLVSLILLAIQRHRRKTGINSPETQLSTLKIKM